MHRSTAIMSPKSRLLVIWVVCCLFLFSSSVNAWEQSDYELFDLNDEISTIAPEAKDWYELLSVETTATDKELVKAYRKASLQYHPDKNSDPIAGKIFTALTSIINILKTPDLRERYDFFRLNGFPKWRGTGYYYSRFKPGLGFVSIFLILFISVVQYLSGIVTYFQNRGRFQELELSLNEMQYKQFKSLSKKYGLDRVTKEEFAANKRQLVANVMGIDLEYEQSVLSFPKLTRVFAVQLPIWIYQFTLGLPNMIKEWKEVKKVKVEDDNGGNNESTESLNSHGSGGKKGKLRKRHRHASNGSNSDSSLKNSSSNDSLTSSSSSSSLLSEDQLPSAPTSTSSSPVGSKSPSPEPVDPNSNPFGSKNARRPVGPSPLGQSSVNREEEVKGSEKSVEGKVEEVKEKEPELKEGPWASSEIVSLSKLMKKYPGGKPGRWVLIANELKRGIDDVAGMAKKLMEDPNLGKKSLLD